jgi:hypothetical protein
MVDWFSYFASGMPWTSWDENNPNCFTLPQFLNEHPLLGYSMMLLIVIGLSAGIATLLSNRQRCWLLLPLLAPGIFSVLHAKIGSNIIYPWYMVGFLPLSIVVFAIGFDRIGQLIPRRSAMVVISILFLLVFGLTTQTQRQLYRNHPVEALAEAVRLTRKVINPFHPDINEVITLDIVHATRLYDPAQLRVRSLEAFIEALKLADSSNRPLYLNLGNPGLLRRDLPGIGQLIDNREIFTSPTLIHGLQNPCTRYIFQYRPHSIENASILDKSSIE